MSRKRLRLLVPLAFGGAMSSLLLAPSGDPFAEFARIGTEIPAARAVAMMSDPPRETMPGVGLAAFDRSRAWQMPWSPAQAEGKLLAQGLRPVYFRTIGTPGRDQGFYASHRVFYRDETETDAHVIQGTKVPPGSGCVVLVDERMDFSGVWGRFRARFGR